MKENIKILDELITILLNNKLIIPWQKEYANRLGDIFIKYNICKKNKNKYVSKWNLIVPEIFLNRGRTLYW